MRTLALALISAVALAACNPSAPSGDAGSGGGLFPNLTSASYRAEATITDQNGASTPVVMVRDGNKLRMEISAAEGQSTIISNGDTQEAFVITTAAGRTMAMRADMTNYQTPDQGWSGDMAANATRTGTCSVAGQTGSEWTRTDQSGDTACITDDGIILRATEDGRTSWETTSVQRGPQDPALFALPEGVQVMDLSAMAQGAAAAAQGARGNAQLCTALRDANAPAEALSRAGC